MTRHCEYRYEDGVACGIPECTDYAHGRVVELTKRLQVEKYYQDEYRAEYLKEVGKNKRCEVCGVEK